MQQQLMRPWSPRPGPALPGTWLALCPTKPPPHRILPPSCPPPRYGVNWLKLRIFGLEEYDALVLLDTDMAVVGWQGGLDGWGGWGGRAGGGERDQRVGMATIRSV